MTLIQNSEFARNGVITHKHANINSPRIGKYMHSANGRKLWPFDMRPEDFDINVIAHHLATQNRWQGATQHKKFKERISFSVAEHSVYVAMFVRTVLKLPEFELEALLHDAPEYVIGDLIRPLKYSPEFEEPFKKVEDKIEGQLAVAFNLVWPFPKAVKIGDEAVCAAEAIQIVVKDPTEEWVSGKLHDDSQVAPYDIAMMGPYEAKQFFLAYYQEALDRRAQYRALPLFARAT